MKREAISTLQQLFSSGSAEDIRLALSIAQHDKSITNEKLTAILIKAGYKELGGTLMKKFIVDDTLHIIKFM